jgi:uncharacterized membrane protein
VIGLPDHVTPAFATAFLASSVEAVEAATVVLAAGVTRDWRTPLAATLTGAAILVAVIALAGPMVQHMPLAPLQVVTGALLLLFGMRWLRKAILRYAGVIAMRDEDAIFARSRGAFAAATHPGRLLDALTFLAVLKVVLLEGLEVVVIVVGIGSGGACLIPASEGALAACALVAIAAALARRPLARVPENALKLAVGVMVSAFGLFWFGEGIGVHWPFADATILLFAAMLLAASGLGVRLARA